MADIEPNPPAGAVPPKPAEAAKVQPKKETVRITLPPKPTAAPTVRLPAVTPTATATTSSMAAAPAAPAPAAPAPAAATATAPTLPMRPGTVAAPPAAAAPKPGPFRPQAAAPAVSTAARPAVTTLDLSLAIAAAVVGLLVLVRVLLLANIPS